MKDSAVRVGKFAGVDAIGFGFEPGLHPAEIETEAEKGLAMCVVQAPDKVGGNEEVEMSQEVVEV